MQADIHPMHRPKYIGLFILFMVPLTGMGIDLYTPSLPWLVKALDTSTQLVKLTIATYLLGYGIGPLFAGSCSDAWGRRPVLMLGMGIYIIACLLIVLIPNIHLMLWMRVLQGVGAAFLGVTFRSMMSDSYKGFELKKMAASMALAWSIGPIIAPFIGGYLQHYFGWQSNFIFFIVYSGLILLFACFIPETNHHRVPLHPKAIMSSYRMVLSHPLFWMGGICMGVGYGFIVIFNVIGPFLIQEVLHLSAIVFGYIALVMGFAFFLGMMLNRILVYHFKIKSLITLGLVQAFIFMLIFLILGIVFPVNIYLFTIPVFLILFGASFVFPHCMGLIISLFPKSAGVAGALSGVLLSLISMLSSVIASFLLANTQVPMAIVYIVLLVICGAVFFSVSRRHAID